MSALHTLRHGVPSDRQKLVAMMPNVDSRDIQQRNQKLLTGRDAI